jgi:outer membrane protein TolC
MCIRPVLQILGWLTVTGVLGTLAGCAGVASQSSQHQTTFWTSPFHALGSVSNGSACSSNDKKASELNPTLAAAKPADSSVRPVVWQQDNSATGALANGDQTNGVLPDEIPAPKGSINGRYLSLRDAIDTALLRNPDANTARANGPVSDATRVVTATYPWNPAVQVQVDPSPRAEDGSLLQTRNQVIVTQTVELAHQSRYRRQAADAGWNQQRAVIAQSEWTVAISAMRAYFEAMYRKGVWDVDAQSADLQAQMSGIVDRRFTAGLATPTERLTARVTARQLQRQAELANADYLNSVNALRTVLNLPAADIFELDARAESYRWLSLADGFTATEVSGDTCQADSDGLDIESISNRPDVVAARFAVAMAQSNLNLAKANMVPNVSTGPSYERDENGTLFFGVQAQMDLPVWNTGSPLVRQRSAELQQQLITLKQTQVRAMLQVQSARNRYANARKLWQETWPNTNADSKEWSTAVHAFEQGQATILEVFSVRDALTQEEKSKLDLFHEISQAAVDVIAALAIDPELLIEPGSATTKPSGAAK